jgi:hypothetical protein
MNHSSKKLIGAAIMTGLGLWITAMPAGATALLGIFAMTSEGGVNPNGPVNASVLYNSANGAPFNANLGLTTSNNDPTATISFSPNSLALGGLGTAMVGVTAEGASAQGSADVNTGTTHISGTSTHNSVTEGNSNVNVAMGDTLTFVVNGSDATISMGFSLDGLLGVAGGDEPSYNQEIRYSIGSADMEWEAQSGGNPPPFTGNTSGFDSFAFTNDSITGFNFLGSFTVTNGEVLELTFTQSMNCVGGATCDFSHTGQMSLNLPSDVSFTSTGGFLSQPATSASAPEPGSLLLIGLGMAGIGFFGRRRLTR